MRYLRSLLAATLAALALAPAAARAQGKTEERDRPHDLILAVDVSLSMIRHQGPGGRDLPNDRQGIRWDGIQFTIDVARDHDRIALVLYRAEHDIVTKHIDPSAGGFVRLDKEYRWGGQRRTGRELLTELVAEIQALEQTWAGEIERREARQGKGRGVAANEFRRFDLKLFAGRPDVKIDLAHGTASLLALKTIGNELLGKVRKDGARAWTFLFTDGEEEDDDGQGRLPRGSFDYIKEREKIKDARPDGPLGDWVAPWVKGFRDHKVPIVTFALGKTCDHPLLESIALQSAPPKELGRRGTSYRAETNLELLRYLQHIQWELREYWQRELAPQKRRGQEVFSTPLVQIWRDMGVLLYRLPAGGTRALAPLKEQMRDPRVGRTDLPGLAPRASRSHWYYVLNPAEPPAGAPDPLEGSLEFAVARDGAGEDYTTRGVLALREKYPLFHFRDLPAGLTPRDAIPFEVAFTPYAVPTRAGRKTVPFAAEHFKVEVTLTPASRAAGAPVPPARTFVLERDPRPADDLARRYFRKQVLLDGDPGSRGDKGLSGLYFVDVKIVGLADPGGGERPLGGAVRRLLRRTLTVGPYPELKAPVGPVVLANSKAGATAAIPVELNVQSDLPDVATVVEVWIEAGQASKKGRQLAPARLQVPKQLRLEGKRGSLQVALPAAAWSGLATGDYPFRVHFKTPWGKWSKAAKTELVVRRERYGLRVSPVLHLDLAALGTKEVKRTIPVELDTDLDTEEQVWLSADGRIDSGAVKTLEFRRTEDEKGVKLNDGKRIRLEARGLGPDSSGMAGGPGKKANLSLALASREKPDPGVYEGKVYVVGSGVEAAALTVKLAVNKVGVVHPADARKFLEELPLLGLAGTEVSYPLTFGSARSARQVKKVSVVKGWELLRNKSPRGWDRLPLDVATGGGADRATVGVRVPLCVQEGQYRTEVTFKVTTVEGLAEEEVSVTLPVAVEVRHKGVYLKPLDPKGSLWFHFREPQPAPEFVERTLTLHTDAEEMPVRWSVARAAARPGLGEALPPDDGLLDVRFGKKSVLSQGKAAGAARDPIRQGKPCELTFRASRKGLKPGVYRWGLRFESWEDRSGVKGGVLPDDLTVHVVVPGRGDLKAARVGAGPLYPGDVAAIEGEVACYDRPAEKGTYQLFDAKGQPLGPPRAIEDAGKGEPDPAVPGKTLHRFKFEVTPDRPGAAACEVRWPRYRAGEGPADDVLVARVPLPVLGVIEVRSTAVGVNEEVTIRARIDPARRPEDGRPVVLHAVERGEKDRTPETLELLPDAKAADGDGQKGEAIYSTRHRFGGPGLYDIVSSAEEGPGQMRPQVVHVNYEFRSGEKVGTLEYGSGDWLGWLGVREELSDPRAFQLKNLKAERCRWRARLRFPKGGAEASQVTERTVDSLPADPEPDPRFHLLTKLTGPRAEKTKAGWTAGGVLAQDEEVDLGIDSKLSPPALEEAYGSAPAGAAPHPTLGKSNGMILEVELEWLDNQGQVVERRELRVPFAVATRHWAANPKPWIVGGAILVGVLVLARMLLRSLRRRPKLAAAQASSPQMSEDAIPTLTDPVAPAKARREAPRAAAPRPVVEEDPDEHMR